MLELSEHDRYGYKLDLMVTKMDKPDLDRMWETFIQMPNYDSTIPDNHIRIIRSHLSPLLFDLKQKFGVDWYCFLIHNRESGVPTSVDDDHAYFHVRFALREDVEAEELLQSLQSYCTMTRKVQPGAVQSIAGIDASLLKNDDVREAWRMIGEQSEWVLNMLSIHKPNVDLFPRQIEQFLHFYANMTQAEALLRH